MEYFRKAEFTENTNPVQDMYNYYKENNLDPTTLLDNDALSHHITIDNTTKPKEVANPLDWTKNYKDYIKKLIKPETVSSNEVQTPTLTSTSTTPTNITTNINQDEMAKKTIKFFENKGFTKEQAAGIAGNINAESGFNTNIKGDGGKAIGLAQWHPDRQANFKKIFKKDISNSSFEDQLEFINWELNNTEKNALNKLKSSKTSEEATKAFAHNYERMAKYEDKRHHYAAKFLSKYNV